MIAGLLHRRRRGHARAKRDANHTEIVKALEAAGCTVLDLAAVGGGCPDILVGHGARNVLLEIKRPGVFGKKRGKVQAKTDTAQKTFRETWRGDVAVVWAVDDALRAVGLGLEARLAAIAEVEQRKKTGW